ncbi:hypothetical protein CRX67_27550 [Enterobacteriaceae bacterium A-F18]|nr:hypothetical protein CRX67_27550 [Enterobacteriaceae bacterium A-F18]
MTGRAFEKRPSLPFLAFDGDDVDQSPGKAFIHCITSQDYRNFMHSLGNYFSLCSDDILQK